MTPPGTELAVSPMASEPALVPFPPAGFILNVHCVIRRDYVRDMTDTMDFINLSSQSVTNLILYITNIGLCVVE